MNVLIVSPELERRVACGDALGGCGFNVDKEPSPADAMALERRRSDRARADVIVLAGLGLQATRQAMQALAKHPVLGGSRVLVVDERLHPADVARLLDDGADDVYQRPFVPAIYAARVRGLLRRPKATPAAEDPAVVARVGLGLKVHLVDRQLSVDGVAASLSRSQFDLLVHLVRNVGRACPAATLRQTLGKTVLYASAERIVAELSAVRSALGRFAGLLEIQADGGATLRAPAEAPGSPA